MLIVTAFLRLGGARERLYTLVCRRLDPLLVGLGVLLGLTNLGGGVLMVVVSSLYEDKHRVRAQIAFCYGLVGMIQVATPATTSVDWSPLLPLVAATAYAAVGRHAFQAVGGPAYQHTSTPARPHRPDRRVRRGAPADRVTLAAWGIGAAPRPK